MLVVITKKGIAIRFKAEDLRLTQRGGKGARAIKLEKDDEVVSVVEDRT